jgi:hypothetical protein
LSKQFVRRQAQPPRPKDGRDPPWRTLETSRGSELFDLTGAFLFTNVSPMQFSPPIVAFALAATLLPVYAERDAAPINTEQILQEVEQLEAKQKDRLLASKTQMVNILQNSLKSGPAASRLYEDAVEATQFNGLKDKSQAFSDWKKKNADLLRSQEMQTALELHLRYLVLSLHRADSGKPNDFVNPSLSYINDVSKMLLDQAKGISFPPEAKGLLDRSLADSIFAKWMLLGPWLPKANDWELNPGNIDGIFEKNIRQSLRKENSPLLVGTWDLQIKIQADRITLGRLDYEADKFHMVTQPRMLFSRANDMTLVGLKSKGCAEILQLLRSHPEHPDFPQWAKTIRQVLSPPQATESPSPSP